MDKIGLLSVVASALCNATIGVFSRLSGLDPELITMSRLFFGAVFVLLFLAFRKRLFLLKQRPTLSILINGTFLAGFMFFYVKAMNYTSMANAIMMVYMAPVVAAVLAHFILKERLMLHSFALILLALLGFLMMMEFQLNFAGNSQETIGIGYGFLALLSYSGFMVFNRAIKSHNAVYTSTFWQLMAGALILLPAALPSFQGLSVDHLPWMLGVGLIPGFLGIFTAIFALSRMPTTTFATLSYFEAVVVLFWGWSIFNEALNTLQLAGCSLIIASGILNMLISSRTAAPLRRDTMISSDI